MKLATKHVLTGAELSGPEIENIVAMGITMKQHREAFYHSLPQHYLAMLFEKPSLRTRFSFMVAMQELGGAVIESVDANRKFEEPQDQMRVLQGYCSAVMVRTHGDDVLQKMSSVAKIPVINGLSEGYHPCQTLADLMTLKEKFGQLQGLTVTYLGDGNNILHSLLLMAPKVGVKVHYCCPADHQPNPEVLAACDHTLIEAFSQPELAVANVDAVYTDVWTSMGFDDVDESQFAGFQVNENTMQLAKPGAIFLHCMPMMRGKEVSETLPDQSCSAIFDQSENRMHAQKALLHSLLS